MCVRICACVCLCKRKHYQSVCLSVITSVTSISGFRIHFDRLHFIASVISKEGLVGLVLAKPSFGMLTTKILRPGLG